MVARSSRVFPLPKSIYHLATAHNVYLQLTTVTGRVVETVAFSSTKPPPMLFDPHHIWLIFPSNESVVVPAFFGLNLKSALPGSFAPPPVTTCGGERFPMLGSCTVPVTTAPVIPCTLSPLSKFLRCTRARMISASPTQILF